MAPSVSICLTAYNRCGLIGRTIESLLAQDYGDFELLIWDDASDDGTEEVCRRYEQGDRRVHYHRNATNLGMPGNLNAAIAAAHGEFVANLHDGDVYRPDLLRTWRRALVQQDDAAFVFNALEALDSSGAVVRAYTHPFGPRLERMQLVAYMLERFDSPVWGAVMARRECYDREGLFDARFGFIADVEMWMRLNLKYAVAYVDQPLIGIAPVDPNRPWAFVNWFRESALIAIHEEIAEKYYSDRAELARYRRRLRRRRDRRWLWLVGACIKRRRADLLREARPLFVSTRGSMLRVAAWLLPILAQAISTRRARNPRCGNKFFISAID